MIIMAKGLDAASSGSPEPTCTPALANQLGNPKGTSVSSWFGILTPSVPPINVACSLHCARTQVMPTKLRPVQRQRTGRKETHSAASASAEGL